MDNSLVARGMCIREKFNEFRFISPSTVTLNDARRNSFWGLSYLAPFLIQFIFRKSEGRTRYGLRVASCELWDAGLIATPYNFLGPSEFSVGNPWSCGLKSQLWLAILHEWLSIQLIRITCRFDWFPCNIQRVSSKKLVMEEATIYCITHGKLRRTVICNWNLEFPAFQRGKNVASKPEVNLNP